METYVYYCETSRPDPKSRWVPGWPHILEIDHLGRRGKIPCYNNPEYRTWWRSVIEDYCNNHDIDGLMWGLERKSAVSAILDGEAASCFCEHCMEKARRKNIDGERAKEGYAKLYAYVKACKTGVGMPDGYLASFVRILMRYPEILQWEKLWYESHTGLAKEVYGTGKWLSPEKAFGLGVWQVTETFSFWLRSMYDYSDFVECADFIKPILYNIPASSRIRGYYEEKHKTLLRDFDGMHALMEAVYPILGLKGQPEYEKLNEQGFSVEYIRNAVKRIRGAVADTMPVFAGIPSGVPTGEGLVESRPEDIAAAVQAAFEAGGKGVVLSRNYSEANLDNMRACKKVVDALGLDIEACAGKDAGEGKSVY
jgi:hypothetical protein